LKWHGGSYASRITIRACSTALADMNRRFGARFDKRFLHWRD
jgi:hypothetical protein